MTGLIPVRGSVGTASTTMRKICAGALVCLLTAACGRSGAPSPVAPSESKAAATPAIAAGGSIFGAASADLARCLQSAGDAACFSGARPIARASVAGAAAPDAPSGLTATAIGHTVTLVWNAPASGDVLVTYVIEAGSAPGLANLAVVMTNSTATTFSADGVGNGTYFVRVKAQNAAGTSAPSNEVTLIVGGSGCTSAPNAPTGLSSGVSGSTVTFTWSAPSGECAPTSYVLQAGSSSGLSNLANAGTGNTSTTYVATGVPAGTYYVRVRAQNAAGQSGASNEVTVTLCGCAGSPITITISPNPVPYSGTGTTSAGCGGIPDTWYYTQTIQTASIGATVLNHWSLFDGRRTADISSNIVISARGSYAYSTVWCPSGTGASGSHTVQTTWTGTDANGNPFSHTGPTVQLQAKGSTPGKRTFPAVWISASWSGGRTGTPLSSRGIDPPTHFGTLCLANSVRLENHPGGTFANAEDSLFATNTGCSSLLLDVAFCRTSGSGGGASSIPICAQDPKETPASNLRFLGSLGRAGSNRVWIGTTPINFDVNVFWCSDKSSFNFGAVRGIPQLECVEQ